jgi:hypothetical protein
MLLLIKTGMQGLAAHLANASGQPICKSKINLTNWRLQERCQESVLICANCRRIRARGDATKQ